MSELSSAEREKKINPSGDYEPSLANYVHVMPGESSE